MEELSRELEKGLKYSVIPLKKLVTIQLATGLYTLLYTLYTKTAKKNINHLL